MQPPPGQPPYGQPPWGQQPYAQPQQQQQQQYPQQQQQQYPQQQQQQPYPQQPQYPQQQQQYPQQPQYPPTQPMQAMPPMQAAAQPAPQAWGPQPGAAPMQPQMPMQMAQRPAVHMSGGIYITLYVLCMLATIALAALGSQRASQEALPFVPLPMFVLSIVMMVFIYRMWSAINDGQTKPSPGAALGFMFIPFFSLYWVFVVYPGWASRYNAYAQRNGIQVPQVGAGLFIAALLCGWIPLVGLILWAIVLGKVCGAVNRLSPRR